MYRFKTSNQIYASNSHQESTASYNMLDNGMKMVDVMDEIRKTRLRPVQTSNPTHPQGNIADETSRRDSGNEFLPTITSDTLRKPFKGIYLPSSYDYGSRTPTAIHLPDRHFPKTNTFSNSFTGRQTRSAGFITTCSRSRVHSELDEYH